MTRNMKILITVSLACLSITSLTGSDKKEKKTMDKRDIHSGYTIPKQSYCDQPYVVVNEDGSFEVGKVSDVFQGPKGFTFFIISEQKGGKPYPLDDELKGTPFSNIETISAGKIALSNFLIALRKTSLFALK